MIHCQNLTSLAERLQQLFDYSIWYTLSLWPALHVACQNSWGGEATQDKKDWFAGAVSEIFTSDPDTDQDDLEVFLLQIMQDEFDCNVEDDSELEVAGRIVGIKKQLMEGNVTGAKDVEQRYKNRGQLKMNIQVIDNEANEDIDEEEWNGFDDEEMGEAPSLVPSIPVREKVEPEVDDDGFTKVVSKKKR